MLSQNLEQYFFYAVCLGENCYLWITAEAILEFRINRQFTEQIGGKNGGVSSTQVIREIRRQNFSQYTDLLTQLCLKYSVQFC